MVTFTEKHLPAVFACLRDGDEVIVVDDASTDTSVEFQNTYPFVHLIQHRNTMRYAQSCNDGVAVAKNPLIFPFLITMFHQIQTLYPLRFRILLTTWWERLVVVNMMPLGRFRAKHCLIPKRMFVHARAKEQTA